jgi:hypothetical protein
MIDISMELLVPFAEAAILLEGRGNNGRHGAIWKVFLTFEWLLDEPEALKDRLDEVDSTTLQRQKITLCSTLTLLTRTFRALVDLLSLRAPEPPSRLSQASIVP